MGESENVIEKKSYSFAIKVIETYKKLQFEKKEFVLSKQFLRSGTSIGSNIQEGVGAQSRPDFISKINIAYKEARETTYWINLLRDIGFLDNEISDTLIRDCLELQKILAKILISSRK